MNTSDFNFAALQSLLPQGTLTTKTEYSNDDRFWKLSRNEDDTGSAVIRLLVDKNRLPFVKIFHYNISVYDAVKQKKRWFIEDSPQSIGLPCPVSERWAELNNEGSADSKEKAKLFARKVKFITNIKVINDPSNPANNGKVFLWEFGAKLLDKFIATMNPNADDQKLGIKPVELYDPMRGANIMIKIKKSSGFFNYDDTLILPPSTEWDSMESAVSEIDAKTYDLKEFLDPKNFSSYDELKSKLDYVVTGVSSRNTAGQANTTTASNTAGEYSINSGMPPSTATAETKAPIVERQVEQPSYTQQASTTSASLADDGLDFLDDL